jgi:hypothetical protein
MNFDFDSPPKGISILAHAGGVVTAVVAIATLQYWSSHFSKTAPKPNYPAIATRTSQSPSPLPLVETEAEKALDKKVEQKAAACKFDQSLTPNSL